ncbi:MAG: hypothetical protein ACK6AD_15800 [Cyanobacteriota bacterium]|jgi:hypothetical protein
MPWIRRALPSLACVLLVQAACVVALWLRQSRLAPPTRPAPHALLVQALGSGALER